MAGNNLKLSDEEINIRINNALATASKDILNNIKSNWDIIDDYVFDDNFSVISGLLKDFIPVVASEKYIIFSNDMLSVVDRFNESSTDIEKFLKKVFDFNPIVVAITTKRWDEEKSKYISNLKSGIKYSIIESSDNKTNVNAHVSKGPVDDLINLVGEGIIEYK